MKRKPKKRKRPSRSIVWEEEEDDGWEERTVDGGELSGEEED